MKTNYSFYYRNDLLRTAYLERCPATSVDGVRSSAAVYQAATVKARQQMNHGGTRAEQAFSYEQKLLEYLPFSEVIAPLVLKANAKRKTPEERCSVLVDKRLRLVYAIAKIDEEINRLRSPREYNVRAPKSRPAPTVDPTAGPFTEPKSIFLSSVCTDAMLRS